MQGFQSPEVFFMATLSSAQQKFLKTLLINALKAGYTKFIEPCAGSFAMSHLAVQAGFKPAQIETSDVSIFTSIMGYAINEKPLEELCLRAKGFSDEELTNPATALYAWKYLSLVKKSGQDYFYNYLIDLEQRRDEHIKFLDEQLKRAKNLLNGMSYRALDMWDHIDEVLDNPHALVIANPPTYLSGFEKYYDTDGNMTWKEPIYSLFNPETGLAELMNRARGAKCLLICYEENEPGKTAGEPIFAQYNANRDVNVYLTSNRPDEAIHLARGKKIFRPCDEQLTPLQRPLLATDYEITEKSKIQILNVETPVAEYYRKLWTHNFTGSKVHLNFVVLIDGNVMGVFGYNKSDLHLSIYACGMTNLIYYMYGMTIPHKKYRLNRLLTMLAQSKDLVLNSCDDFEKIKVKGIKTTQRTKYPEALDMRGIMKLSKRKKLENDRYILTYTSDLKERTEQETLVEWLRRENKWLKERAKAKK